MSVATFLLFGLVSVGLYALILWRFRGVLQLNALRAAFRVRHRRAEREPAPDIPRFFDGLLGPPLSWVPMPRTLIVGFDGATGDLCERWISEDRMPVLAGLMGDGSHGPMRSTLPSNSAVAWTSLSTGASPGRHGIFDFVLPRGTDYGYRVATREDRRVPALWSHASARGARVGIVNIPMTFPAEPVNGVMVSGMDAPQLDDRAGHPRGHLAELRRLSPGYRIISNAHHTASKGDFDASERELIDVLVARSRYTCELAQPRDLDLLMVNFEATDGAHHFFWQHHDPAIRGTIQRRRASGVTRSAACTP